MLSGKRWPAHPHPYRDELLSSWLVRIAHANGLKIQTFCNHEFGANYQIWNRDIDRLSPTWLIEAMSKKTCTPLKRVWETTLLGYEGKLYEKQLASGQLRWIIPLQIYHRKRLGHGIQFCPRCLAGDEEPYYRRAWRVALYTFCPRHDVMLLDRCPQCDNGVAFHRQELGRPDVTETASLACCWYCGFDLSLASVEPVQKWNKYTFQSWGQVLRLIDKGTKSSMQFDYSKLAVLHHFCVLLASTRLAPKLKDYLLTKTKVPILDLAESSQSFESRIINERQYVVGLSWWLLGRWPSRLISAWINKAIRYNELLKDFRHPPNEYLEITRLIAASIKTNTQRRR